MASKDEIFAVLLNRYMQERSREAVEETEDTDGIPEGPLYGVDLWAEIEDAEEHKGERLAIHGDVRHMRMDLHFPATVAGLLLAKRAVDDLADLAATALGLGDELEFDEDDGYYIEVDGDREYLLSTGSRS